MIDDHNGISNMIILNLIILTALDGHYKPVREILVGEVNRQGAFRLSRKSGQDFGAYFIYSVNAERGSSDRLVVTLNKVSPNEIEGSWQMSKPNAHTPPRETLLSDLPCGERARVSQGRLGRMCQSLDGVFLVQTKLSYRGQAPPEELAATDSVLAEGLLRRCLARSRGLQTASAASVNIAGTSVEAVTGPRGERLIDFARYCQALQISPTWNAPLGTASFIWNNEMVIVPLAAKRIKDGARWIESNDITLIRDGKWYASYAALQQARGQ
jgi:hypothetical protein